MLNKWSLERPSTKWREQLAEDIQKRQGITVDTPALKEG
jgi:hypothetical protein